MRIGPYTLKNNIVVAPMAGVTDRPFRQLCKKYGAGMAVSEMVTSNSLLYGAQKLSEEQTTMARLSLYLSKSLELIHK